MTCRDRRYLSRLGCIWCNFLLFYVYLKVDILVRIEALLSYFYSFRRGGYVIFFIGYFQEEEGRGSRGGVRIMGWIWGVEILG